MTIANDYFNEYEEIVLTIYGGSKAESRNVLARTEKLCRVVEKDDGYIWEFVEPDFKYGPMEAIGEGLWVNQITCWNPKFEKEFVMWPRSDLNEVMGFQVRRGDTYTALFKNEALRVLM